METFSVPMFIIDPEHRWFIYWLMDKKCNYTFKKLMETTEPLELTDLFVMDKRLS